MLKKSFSTAFLLASLALPISGSADSCRSGETPLRVPGPFVSETQFREDDLSKPQLSSSKTFCRTHSGNEQDNLLEFRDPNAKPGEENHRFVTHLKPPVKRSSTKTASPIDSATSGICVENAKPKQFDAQNLGTIQKAQTLAEKARTQELLEQVVRSGASLRESARSDYDTLEKNYRDLPAADLLKRLQTARKALDSLCGDLETATGGVSDGERLELRNTCLNAKNKAGDAAELINKSQIPPEEKLSLFSDPHLPNATLAGLIAPGEALDFPLGSDGFSNRLLMLAGLPEGKRASVFAQLKLARTRKISFADGSSKSLKLLHNLPAASDCPSWLSYTLSASGRRNGFTGRDLRAMWEFQKTGTYPSVSQWNILRGKMLQSASEGFVPVDLHAGAQPAPGDLLVYRPPWSPAGYVFLVKDYDSSRMIAKVYESIPGAGTVRERDLPLSIDPIEAEERRIRPGILDLRLKAESEKCGGGQ